ncbi:MAG: Unknown protein [uncultured Sulfurovum sp.]|uniref:Outer membrane protein beta-barrel domain-containing protein n=1 Tax=uncultured Sulfurovum sp. TaxID=269237 RepID=A0A6S6TFT8_9BACT|nr:MAG: Unknown protein [uncultured Sulfurovum sp.]
MLKKIVISMMIISSLTIADTEVSEKNWFMEFGYQTSVQQVNGSFDSQTSGESWEGVTDNLYLEIGRNFSLNSEFSLAPNLGFTQATLLGDDYHNDAITLELPLFYNTKIFSKDVKVGPSFKYIFYPSNYYNHRDGQVDFGTQNAFAYGLQSLWGSSDTKFSLGLEYLNSANYEKVQGFGERELKSSVEMNGLYLNVGLNIGF